MAKLREVVSLWPGRDQYIDHSAAAAAGQPFQLFHMADLAQNTPHVLYLAHDRLLALSGASAVTVTFELTTPSSEYLDIRWEYWDGAVWRPFADMRPACSNAERRSAGQHQRAALKRGVPAAGRLRDDRADRGGRVIGLLGPRPAGGDPAAGPGTGPARGGQHPAEHHDQPLLRRLLGDPEAAATDERSARAATDLFVRVLDATGVPLDQVEVNNWTTGQPAEDEAQGLGQPWLRVPGRR